MKTTIRKSLSMIMAVLLLLSAFGGFTFSASAEGEYTSGYYTYYVRDNQATITDCDTSISGDIVTPATLGGYPVTSIGYYAFEDCTAITSITISEGVTSIQPAAFKNCTALKTIHIPASTTKYIWLTAGDPYAFEGCTALEEITVAEGNTKYYSDENGVLFEDSTLLFYPTGNRRTSYTVPDYVTAVNGRAFENCQYLESVTIPDTVVSVGADSSSAFKNCINLRTVNWGDSISTIFPNTFYGCSSLESITIPSGVSEIGASAFYGCTSLEEIVIPDSVYYIENSAFFGCTALADITIPEHTSFVCNTFSNTAYWNNDENWEDGAIYIGTHLAYIDTSLKSYTVKDGTTTIAASAINYISDIDDITIPDSVFYIGHQNFYAAIFNEENWSGDGLYINNHLVAISENASGTFRVKEGTLTVTGSEYVDSNLEITSIILPDSVVGVGGGSFIRCESLKSIVISDNLRFIGFRAFYDGKLNSITFPATIEYIGTDAFGSCNDLRNIYFTETDGHHISLGYSVFDGCDISGYLILPEGITHLSTNVIGYNESLNSVHIPDSIEYIDLYNFIGGDEYDFYICAKTDSDYLRAYAEENGFDFRVCTGHEGHTPSDPTQPDDPVNPDNPTDDWEDSTPVINQPSKTTVNFGETLVLQLEEIEISEGYAVAWFVEGAGVSTWVSEDGLECRVTSIANGNPTVYAKLVDEEENPVTNADGEEILDEITIVSKAGFWQKFLSFFKNLFGINRVIY